MHMSQATYTEKCCNRITVLISLTVTIKIPSTHNGVEGILQDCSENYSEIAAPINSAAFLPLISIPPKIGPMRKLPLTPLAAMPETKRPG